VKLLAPGVPGVPDSVPPGESVMPAGRDPVATDHE
jgi:hypothetical protein